jgi:hypothetical protein
LEYVRSFVFSFEAEVNKFWFKSSGACFMKIKIVLLTFFITLIFTQFSHGGKIGDVKRYHEESKSSSSGYSSGGDDESCSPCGNSDGGDDTVDVTFQCLSELPTPSYTGYPYRTDRAPFVYFTRKESKKNPFFGKIDFAFGADTGSDTLLYKTSFSANLSRFFLGLGINVLKEETDTGEDTLTIPYIQLGFDLISFDKIIIGPYFQASTVSELNDSQAGAGIRMLLFPGDPVVLSFSYAYSSGDYMYLNHLDAGLGFQLGRFSLWGGIYLLGFNFAEIEEVVEFSMPYVKLSLWF